MRLMRFLSCALLLPVAVGLCVGRDAAAPPAGAATQEKAAITGTVSDPSGTGVAGAEVTAKAESGASQTVTADGQGLYAITDLTPGKYTLSVVAHGAKIFQADIVLSPAQVLTMSVSGAAVAQTLTPGNQPAEAAPAPSAATPAVTPAAPAAPEAAAPVPATPAPATPAQAPPPTGSGPSKIGGSVTDPTGAVIVGASVKLTGPGGPQTAVSDAKGNYSFNDLAPGTYSVTVNAPGFTPFTADNISVTAGSDIPLDAGLVTAGGGEHIEVQEKGAANVETEKAEVSGTITEKEVVKLGLNGRNFTQFLTLAPGVSNQTGQDEAKVGIQGSVKYSVNGGRVEYNSFEVDGSNVLNAGLSGAESTLIVYPSLDAIKEVKVLTSNYGAQYGRTASGAVIVTTKSGGAKWHGDAYEFFRNENMNARNYFDQVAHAPKYRRNDFGFTLGGPLSIPHLYNNKKDKTFVFFSEEVRIENSPSELQPDFNRAVPTVAERQGNFSDVCPNPVDPIDARKLNIDVNGTVLFPISNWPDCPRIPFGTSQPGLGKLFQRQDLAGNQTYNSLINPTDTNSGLGGGLDPNALALLGTNLIPLPNSYLGCNSSLVGMFDHTSGQLLQPCYDAVISEPTYWREELFRIDHQINPSTRASFRYIHDSWDTTTPTPNWGTVTNTLPTVQNRFTGPGIDLLARITQTITPTLLNEFVLSYNNSHITLANVNGPGGANYLRPAGLGDPNSVGNASCLANLTDQGIPICPMGYLFNNGFGGKAPGLVIAGNNQEYGGTGFVVDPSYTPWEHTNPTYSVRDDVSKAIGKHTLQLGVQYILAQKSETNGALSAATGDVQGLLTFSNVNGGSLTLGNAFANFLYNDNSSFIFGGGNALQSYTQDSTQNRYYNRYQIVEPYAQDDWKVTSHLTVNLGLRISIFGNYSEKYRQAYNWDPNAFSRTLAAQVKVDPFNGELENLSGSPIPLDLSNLDPRIINGIVQCGTRTVPAGCIKDHLFNPAPRVGFAWAPGNGKNSLRGGYGLFFEHGTGDEANTGSLEGSAPLVLSVTQPFAAGYACIGNFAPNCDSTGNNRTTRPGAFPINVLSIPSDTKFSYSQQWSLSVQRELPKSFVASVAYVGSKGTHLTVERQLNQLGPVPSNLNPFALHEPIITSLPGGGNPGGDCHNTNSTTTAGFQTLNSVVVSPQNPAYPNFVVACQGAQASASPSVPITNTFRPYPGLGSIFSLQNAADSSYHGFQTTLRRTAGSLTAGVAYTFSHSIDDSSDRTDPTFVNSLDLRSNKASSNFDQRHLLNISYVYVLPKFSKVFSDYWTGGPDATPSPAPSRLAHLLADDWEVSGITTFQTGTPFSVINNAGTAGVGVLDNAGVANGVGAGSYPDLASHPRPAALKENASSFGPLLLNPNQFVAPRGLTFGNAGRNYLNNPRRLNFDMSLLKHFTIKEGSQIELRAEAFNVFNHTQFRIYNPDLHNTGSNSVSCYGGSDYSAGTYFPGGADCLTGNSFLHPVDAHRPRTLQLAIKYNF